jgi:hypothetical protein
MPCGRDILNFGTWKSRAGVTLVEKLRTIVLFQGDFNYLSKYIGRHMMKDGEAYEQMVWDKYGSREGKNVIEQALNKVLSFDLIRQARMDATICSNDAKSCCDMIVHAIAYIIMQHQNFPASACICVFTTLVPPAMSAVLAKSHICRSFPTSLLHA